VITLEETMAREGVRRATGRSRDEWFGVLDAWGAAGRPYREIADWLSGEHQISSWWAQKLIVEYEQARGVREAGARPGGTFAAGASKTVAVPVERLTAAFVDAELRARWLPDVVLHERTSQAGRSIRFDLERSGARSRLNVTFASSGEGKSRMALEEERLPDARAAEEARGYWRERLAALKALVEG
jgi:uncharacterized protein YndB with AHSA1/START domain